jgi:hypothetical protein
MGLAVIGLAVSLVGSLVQGVMAGQAAKLEAEVANEQLKMDIETNKIEAMHEQNNRTEDYMRREAANRVAVAAATGGFGSNVSYEQGIAPYNKTVWARDMATIGFNRDMTVGRKQYQIAANKVTAKATATSAMVGAAFDGFATIGSYVSRPGGLLS